MIPNNPEITPVGWVKDRATFYANMWCLAKSRAILSLQQFQEERVMSANIVGGYYLRRLVGLPQ